MGQPSGDFRQEGVRPRTGELVSGGLLVSVGGPDGSEARPCPEEWRPRPRRTARRDQSRGQLGPSPAVGPLALGSGPADLPLLDREADVAQLLGRLAEGRSIRLVGQAGSGRSALLKAVAEAAADLAPDGVVQLCGHRRSAADLLQELFAATHHAPGFRPDPAQLSQYLATVGAIVVIDELGPAGAELETMLAAAPDCAFLVSVAPDSPSLPLDSRLEDHLVAGLSRSACLALTARLAGRALDEAERAWAVDLWFESEGLPLRFVQAAALLRQRDVAVDALVAAEEDRHSVFGTLEKQVENPDPAVREARLRQSVSLPSVAESAAPAVRLAQGLSESAQVVLRLAVALGGECPTAPHLPALIDVSHGESALHELADCGLAVSIGGHHRLTAGALELLAPHWPAADSTDGAAQHFSWWVGHSSVSTEQIAAEAEVVIGAMTADREAGRPQAVLRLAKAAAPALALALRWGAWEQALELGLEAARETGSAVDEAWFRHELGVYALCVRSQARAAAELESAITLRQAANEPRGSAAAGRMLDLLRADRDLPDTANAPSATRRPVIRAIAAQVPWRFRSTPGTGRTSRTVLAASAAVLALGVLGAAIGLSVAGPDSRGGGTVRPGSPEDLSGMGGNLPLPTMSGSATDSPEASPTGSESATPDPSASSASPSASRSPSKKPSKSASPSASTPSESSSVPAPPVVPPVQPPAPNSPQPPVPRPSTSSSAPWTPAPTSNPPTTTPSPSSPAPTTSTSATSSP
ncbi:ATP-binding protein [Kitasatospora sp. NPDC050543]|uniref:ATP-binding protein n=1 Tax=Kitasatospora sp. NPDC050543 TaxID=3364054 RepID=UPI00379E106B